MMYRLAAGLCLGAACLLVSSYLLAQQPSLPPPDPMKPGDAKPMEPPPKPPDVGPTTPVPTEPTDPTLPSDRLREILGQGKALNSALKVPLISIKGRVIVKDKPPAILVDVGGQLQLVTKGSVLAGPANTTLHVTDMTRSTVTIQVMPQNETIVLH